MPYLKFDKPKHIADNKGSCSKLANYLAKEDEKKGFQKEFFFNHQDDFIPSFKVVESIDNNKKGLMKTDAKFYSGSLNFSQKELAFLNNDIPKLKEFTVEIMKEYARNFDKNLTIDDINWFAKVEHQRYYHGSDKEVQNGKAKQGDKKPGLNTHIHFIVGRKSADGKRKLSPASNHRNTKKGPVKGGFDRDRFKNNCEILFDKHFLYNRSVKETYAALKIRKNGTFKEKQRFAAHTAKIESKVLGFYKQNSEDRIHSISEMIENINSVLEGEKLDKQKILMNAKIPLMSSAIYKSLINLEDNLNAGKNIDKPTKVVLNYAEFLNRKIKTLPAGLKEDKIHRACYELNYGQKGKKWEINIPRVMEYERSHNFSGKLVNDIIHITNNFHSNDERIIPGSYQYLFTHHFMSYGGNSEDEEEKKRKKRKKRLRRDNDISR